jgi:hypothetical protein
MNPTNFKKNICKPILAYFTHILKKWLKMIAKILVLLNCFDWKLQTCKMSKLQIGMFDYKYM